MEMVFLYGPAASGRLTTAQVLRGRTGFAPAIAVRSLIFTFTPEPTVRSDFAERAARAVTSRGGTVHFVELTVSPAEQEARIGNSDRKQFRKLSDVATLRNLSASEPPHRLTVPCDLLIDTSHSPAEQTADHIIAELRLTPVEPHSPYPLSP
jgi:hypothetical protein